MEFMVYALRLLSGAGIKDRWTSGDVWELIKIIIYNNNNNNNDNDNGDNNNNDNDNNNKLIF